MRFREITEPSVRERVERGAALLDRVKPAWEESVDLKTLDIRHGDLCVVGQAYGKKSYYGGCSYLGIAPASEEAVAHGFQPLNEVRMNGIQDSEALTVAWIAFIRERRSSAPRPVQERTLEHA